MCSAGKSVFHKALDGLREAGVDIRDPVQLLYVLKMLGPANFEEMFGAGYAGKDSAEKRQPIVPTDVYTLSQGVIDEYGHMLDNPESKRLLEGRKVLIASTDVHAHAIKIIHELLSRAGMHITNLGAEVNPDKIAQAAKSGNAEAILISTHNGMALEYAKRLKTELDKYKVDVPVVMGGVLNQKVEEAALPIDVTSQLKELGFYPSPKLEGKFRELLEHDVISKQ
jgi:methylmalonyl-CoA mutase cobalamin-binding subunit